MISIKTQQSPQTYTDSITVSTFSGRSFLFFEIMCYFYTKLVIHHEYRKIISTTALLSPWHAALISLKTVVESLHQFPFDIIILMTNFCYDPENFIVLLLYYLNI